MEAVPFDTVKDQFKYNTVLADALSDQVTEPRTEGVSTVLEQYFDDVMTMAQSAGKGSSVETAFKKVIGDINMDLAPVSWLKRNEILQHDKVHLAEHHIYGSSRLGMQKYLPDELMFEDTVNASPFTYQSLTKLKPWYSMYGSDLFDTTLHRDSLVKGTISTKGMGVNTHILGNRHYELTNHLGNVQATVLDRTTPVIIDTVLIGYNADISTAQDYYPFGMYMPGRYISDTARHCVTTNTTVMVARPVRVTTAKGKLPAQSMQFGGDPEPPAVGSLPKASAFDDEAPFVFHYNPAEAHPDTWVVNTIPDDETIQYIIDFSDEPSGIGSFLQIHADTNQEVQPVNFGLELLDESMQAKARIRQYFEPDGEEYDATTWEDLTTGDQELFFEVDKASVAAGGLTLLEVVFTSNEPYFALNSKAIMHTPFTLKTSLVPTNVVTTICDDDDDYRFGFNGMEKDNEAKGLGNSLSYEHRIYDSRIGKFLSIDPLFHKYVDMSPYSFSYNSPIYFKDNDGRYIEGANKDVAGGKAFYFMFKGSTIWVNASDDTRRIGNAMLKTATGREMLTRAEKTSYPIGLHINSKLDADPSKFGRTPTKGSFNKDGTFKTTRADVYINVGNMLEWGRVSDPQNAPKYAEQMKENLVTQPAGESRQGMQYFLLLNTGRVDDAIGATGSHEMEHATNPDNIRAVHEYDEGRRKVNYEKEVETTTNEIEQADLDERTKKDVKPASKDSKTPEK